MTHFFRYSKEYKDYLFDLVHKNLVVKVLIILPIIGYFMYSDLQFRDNINAFYTRLLTFSLTIILGLLILATKKLKKIKVYLYQVILMTLPLMMFAKCIVHLNDFLYSSIIGTILVLVMVSIEILTSIFFSATIFFLPPILFISYMPFLDGINSEHYIILSNIAPIIIFGFIANTIQNRLRFNKFKQTQLLLKEKEKTQQYLEKTTQQNSLLQKQKNAMEIQAEDLLRSQEELKKANNTKQKFIRLISHDLRSPMNTIIGLSDILIENKHDYSNEQLTEVYTEINSTATQTIGLFDNLQIWSQSQSDKSIQQRRLFDINQVISRVLTLLSSSFTKKEITYSFHRTENTSVYGDETAIETVIRNLVNNAIKYTDVKGQIDIYSIIDSKSIKVTVKDDGVGIRNEDIPYLFNKEKNIQTPGTQKEKGTGWGLQLCNEFIQQHNGTIEVKSELGKGSEFTIILPHSENVNI